MTLGQHFLVLWIRLYRRCLSGRGALRRVRCTFHHSESCSTFGLRVARTSPSAWVALGRIRRRLRRCRDASIYATGPGALAWGADHDRPLDELLATLTADTEAPASRAVVLAARLAISRFRGDLLDVLAVTPHRALLPPAQLVLRRRDGGDAGVPTSHPTARQSASAA